MVGQTYPIDPEDARWDDAAELANAVAHADPDDDLLLEALALAHHLRRDPEFDRDIQEGLDDLTADPVTTRGHFDRVRDHHP